MKTISAAEANRQFSSLLRSAIEGDEVLMLSRGRPGARIVSALDSLHAGSVPKRHCCAVSDPRLQQGCGVGTGMSFTRNEDYLEHLPRIE